MSSPTFDTMADSDLVRENFAETVPPSSDRVVQSASPSFIPPESLTNVIVFEEGELTDRELLGTGGFGKVNRCLWRKSAKPIQFVAEKQIITTEHLRKESEKALLQETSILVSIKHPNIVKLLGVLNRQESFSLIMEYMDNGSCCEFFRNIPSVLTDEDKWPLKYQISVQVSEAMEYLHNCPRRILHLDLKSRNVLLDNRLNAKLCDFGLSQLKTLSRITQQASKMAAIVSSSKNTSSGNKAKGTITHIAPEHLTNLNYKPTTKSDVYSFGIFLWELLAEDEPYENVFNQELLNELIKRLSSNHQRPDRKRIPKLAPEALKDLMTKCWDGEAEERPEFKEIVRRLHRDCPYTPQKTKFSIKLVLRKVSPDFDLAHSDSQMVMSPPRKEPFPGTTRSEGQSQAVRRPDQHIRPFHGSENGETTAKKLFGHNTQPSALNVSNFPTQNIAGEAYEEPSTSKESTHLTSKDILISDVTEPSTNDDEPLIVGVADPSQATRKRKKRFIIFFVLLGLLAAGVAVFLTLYFIKRNSVACAPLSKKPHQSLSCNQAVQLSSASSSSPWSPLTVGSKCDVVCDQGYGIRSGESRLSCQSGGKWSSLQPDCSKLQSCSTLPPPANGGWYNCTDNFYEMSVCSFSCPAGSHIHLPDFNNQKLTTRGVADTSTTTCRSGSVTWSSPEPYCEIVTQCPALPKVIAGQFVCSPGGATNHIFEDGSYANGTKCSVACNAHFGSKKPSHILCQNNGSWNDTSAPVCMRECSAIPAFNGSFTCTQSLFVTSVCSFTCRENFVRVGPPTISCKNTGLWTNPPPKCVCPECKTGKNCDVPLTWMDALGHMNQSYMNGNPFKYGDHSIKCYAKTMHAHGNNVGNVTHDVDTSSCVCRDVPSNEIQQCNAKKSLRDVCAVSLSSLILKLVYKGMYRLPCDAYLMPPSCEK